MGLVGSLEDLGLGDILQIVSLARKSGVLNLSSGEVKGKIIFKDGKGDYQSISVRRSFRAGKEKPGRSLFD